MLDNVYRLQTRAYGLTPALLRLYLIRNHVAPVVLQELRSSSRSRYAELVLAIDNKIFLISLQLWKHAKKSVEV